MADDLSWLTRDWLSKAAHDLQTARIVSGTPDGPPGFHHFHCQQGVEKAVKGWLAWRGVAAAKTHDLIRLVAEAADNTPDFAQFEEAAEILTPYVSAFRYPGLTEDAVALREEFDAALKHAQTIYDFVVNLLPAEARP